MFANVVNRDYQGTIQQMGDTVKINAIGDITISNYTKDTDMNPPQALTDAQTMLAITQAKYFNFEIDDIDQAQASPAVMGEASSWAGFRAKDTIDQFIASFYVDAAGANLIGSSGSFVTPAAPTQANLGLGTTVYDYLVQLCQLLDQQFVPDDGSRWCVVPPWIRTVLTQDIRWTSFNTPSAVQVIQNSLKQSGANGNAYIGMINNMMTYVSVNAPHLGGTIGATGSQDVIIAGQRDALSFALGLQKTEAYRPPYRFADALKGLFLYGAKTVRPYALAAAYLQHP